MEISSTPNGTAGDGLELTLRYISFSIQRIHLLLPLKAINQANSKVYPAQFLGCAACRAIGTGSCFIRIKTGADVVLRPMSFALGNCPQWSPEVPFDVQVRALIVWV